MAARGGVGLDEAAENVAGTVEDVAGTGEIAEGVIGVSGTVEAVNAVPIVPNQVSCDFSLSFFNKNIFWYILSEKNKL